MELLRHGQSFPYVFLCKLSLHTTCDEEEKKHQHERYKWSHQSEKKTHSMLFLKAKQTNNGKKFSLFFLLSTTFQLSYKIEMEKNFSSFRVFFWGINRKIEIEITTRQAADEQQLSTMCASSSRLVFDIVKLSRFSSCK